jgi:hypothetical protein
MDIVRLATEEEVKPIADKCDLTSASSVVTYGGKDFAVFRNCFELDPVIFGEDTTTKRRALFLMNIETALRLQGFKEIYFNIKADDEQWMELAKHWGAVQTSPSPEIRFKKVL